MSTALTAEIRRRIERHVEELLTNLDLSEETENEARADFVEHLQTETKAQMARGLEAGVALERALERFGDARHIRRQLASWAPSTSSRPRPDEQSVTSRSMSNRRGPAAALAIWVEDLFRDLGFAVRSIIREPGFTATVVLTIAIGIAATTTIFSVVDGVLLRPLPYPDADRIVAVWPSFWFSNNNFSALEQHLFESGSNAFSTIAGYSPRSAHLRSDQGTKSVRCLRVTARFFDVLGPLMTLGRTFDADANEPGNERVVVVSHGFWQRELEGDPSIVDQTVTLEGAEHAVLGVLSPDYDLRTLAALLLGIEPRVELVIPKLFDPDHIRYRSAEMKGLGRLKPGATIEQANAELQAVVARWKEEYGISEDFGVDFQVVPLREFIVGEVRPTMLLLFGSVGLILLIASANVVNLLLTRGIARQREISVRLALGARPCRVVRQLLTESTALALVAAALGLIGSSFAVRGVLTLLPDDTPRLTAIEVDARVAGFAVTLALLTGWLVSIAPTLRLLATRLRENLATGGRGTTGRHYLRSAIVAAEIGLAVMLLIGAGLLVKSFWHLSHVDPGIRTNGLVTFYVGAERGRLQSYDEAEVFHRLAFERIAALPGVVDVSTISQSPYTGDGGVVGCRPFDEANPNAENTLRCRWRPIGSRYFEVAGTPILEGRGFGTNDTEGSEPVAVISRAAARELFPNGDAIGKRIATGFESTVENGIPWATVVGIVADVPILGLAEQSPLLVYRPEVQTGAISDRFGFYGLEYLIRAAPGAAGLEAVRDAVRVADPYGVVSGYSTMEQLIADSVSDRRAVLILMSAFTLAAVILGTIGIYGITAHGVRSRSRELSIRIALGASGRDVVTEVLAAGIKVAGAGALAGLASALALARFIESFLYEVASTDLWVASSALVLALLVSFVATWFPARRAASADPAAALAAE